MAPSGPCARLNPPLSSQYFSMLKPPHAIPEHIFGPQSMFSSMLTEISPVERSKLAPSFGKNTMRVPQPALFEYEVTINFFSATLKKASAEGDGGM